MTVTTTSEGGRPPADRSTGAHPTTFGDYAWSYLARIRAGDIGSLPAVLGLLVLCTVFAIVRPAFLSVGNFANLFGQGASVTLIAMGLVFVLLIGEIDLSAGFASGVGAAVLAVLLTNIGVPWYLCVLAAIVTGSVIGLLLGFLVAKVGIPSFVVTLAGFLGLQGVLLILIEGGTIVPIRDEVIRALANDYLTPVLGWALAVLSVGGYAAVQLTRQVRRAERGLVVPPLSVVLLRIGTLAVLASVAVYFLNLERSRNPALVSLKGVPIVVPLILVLLVAGTYLLNRTQYGRHLYAVGGNREAARRAGIPVDAIRVSAFVLCSSFAAIGGIVAASRGSSVDATTGGSDVLLLAVGAAVVGGTSLFGGRGRLINAVIGGAVVAVIDNGMGLMGYEAGVKFVVTGSVLLLAAGVDALSRRRRTGLAGAR